MLKIPVRKNKSKEMIKAREDISSHELVGFYAKIPSNLALSLEDYLHFKSRKKRIRITKTDWLIEQIERCIATLDGN